MAMARQAPGAATEAIVIVAVGSALRIDAGDGVTPGATSSTVAATLRSVTRREGTGLAG